jgi:hypothetical protein
MGISHNQLVVPTCFSSALRTNRFNDIPSLIDFRTARLWSSGDTLGEDQGELTLPLFFDNLPTNLIEGVSIGRKVPEMSF